MFEKNKPGSYEMILEETLKLILIKEGKLMELSKEQMEKVI